VDAVYSIGLGTVWITTVGCCLSASSVPDLPSDVDRADVTVLTTLN